MKAFIAACSCFLATSCSAILPFASTGGEKFAETVIEDVGQSAIEHIVRVELTKILMALIAGGLVMTYAGLKLWKAKPQPAQTP